MYICNIDFHGVEIEVYGEYIPGRPAVLAADPFDSSPAEPSTIEVSKLVIGGEDVTNLLDYILDEIIDCAVEKYEEERKAV